MTPYIEPPEFLLSVVTEKSGDIVYIHADREGLESLQRVIVRLLKKLEINDCEHDHLFSPDWGGYELTTSMLSSEKEDGCKTVHHVKIYSWTDEWKHRHGLL